jgi:hypothetical protein
VLLGSGGEAGWARSIGWSALCGASGTVPVGNWSLGSAGAASAAGDGFAAGNGAGAGVAAGPLASTLMACGLLRPGPGPTMSTDCSAAAPSRTAPAASTNRGRFGLSFWVTAAGIGVAGLPTRSATPNPTYLSRRLPPTLDLHFRSAAWLSECPHRLCSLRLTAVRYCCNFVTKCAAKCGALALSSRRFGGRDVAFEGVVMRIFVVAAVIAASCALGGCFHFHTSQVVTAPQPLPPLK